MRYFIEFSYKGSNYAGWQIQNNATSIQSILEDAISKILISNIKITGSSRTDAGVHALHQVAHFDTDLSFDIAHTIFRLNNFLPNDIAILGIRPVKPHIHARYDALSRTYQYHITRVKDPFRHDTAYYWYGAVDTQKLEELSRQLLEFEDFKAFCKGNDPKHHYRCKILQSEWVIDSKSMIYTIQANRFLRGMVRSITGTLLDLATGKITDRTLSDIVASGDIKKAGRLLPAHGLTLVKVAYSEDIFID